MTVTAKCLLEAKYAEDAQTTQYTCPPSTRAIIDKMTASNESGSAATISVNLVVAAGSAGATNRVVKALSINAGESVSLAQIGGHTLNAGDFISTIAGTASAIVIRISGREVT